MALHLTLYDYTGQVQLAFLPDLEQASWQEELNAEGAWSVTIPPSGRNVAVARDLVLGQVAFIEDGVEVFRGWYENDTDDIADPTVSLTLSGRGALAILDEATVYPTDYTVSATSGTTPYSGTGSGAVVFTNATPGAMLATLLQRAKARGVGALQGLTWKFNSAADSDGKQWPTVFSLPVQAGTSLLAVFSAFAAYGFCDVRISGTEVQAYAPGSLLATDRPDVLVHTHRDAPALPRTRARRGGVTHLLVLGANEYTEVTAPASAWPARREGSYSATSTAGATLRTLGASQVQTLQQPTQGRTLSLARRPDTPRPWRDFGIGQSIRVQELRQQNGNLEPQRVRTIAAEVDGAGLTSYSLELGDLFVEASVKQARRVDGIANGAYTSKPNPQLVKPATPTKPSASTTFYKNSTGGRYARVNVSWQQVTTDTSGAALTSRVDYRAHLTVAGQPRPDLLVTGATSVTVDTIPPGADLLLSLSAQTDTNGSSDTSDVTGLTVGTFQDPPPQTSTPTCTSGLAIVRVKWDGLSSASGAMPSDLAYVEVHASSTSGFTPTAATLVDQLPPGGGVTPLTTVPYGQTVYVVLVAVDNSGNHAQPSGQASGSPTRAIASDLTTSLLASLQASSLAGNGGWEDPDPGRVGGAARWTGLVTGGNGRVYREVGGSASGGSAYGVIYAEPGSGGRWRSDPFDVIPGSVYRLAVQAHVQGSASTKGFYFRLLFLNADGSEPQNATYVDVVANAAPNLQSTGPGVLYEAQVTVPTNAVGGGKVACADLYYTDPSAPGYLITDQLRVQATLTTAAFIAGTIDAGVLRAQSVTVDRLAAGVLSVGNLTAGILTADVTVSSRIKTASTGMRAELNSAGLFHYDSSGAEDFGADTNGVRVRGSLVVKPKSGDGNSGGGGVVLSSSTGRAYDLSFPQGASTDADANTAYANAHATGINTGTTGNLGVPVYANGKALDLASGLYAGSGGNVSGDDTQVALRSRYRWNGTPGSPTAAGTLFKGSELAVISDDLNVYTPGSLVPRPAVTAVQSVAFAAGDYTAATTIATLTATLQNGRRYRLRASFIGSQVTNSGTPIVKVLQGGTEVTRLVSGADAGQGPLATSALGTYAAGATVYGNPAEMLVVGTGASVTFTVQAQSGAAALRVPASAVNWMTLEDVGTV